MSKNPNVMSIEFRGGSYEINKAALHSMKVQKAMLLADKDQAAAFDAMDKICCGKLDEYLDRMPEEDGELGEFGASDAAVAAFMAAAAEATMAKN